MKDRYLYHAKRTDNGEWVEGFYAVAVDRKGLKQHNILVADNDIGYFKWIVVAPSTICQCSGKPDKNNNLIFEKDIVNINCTLYVCRFDEDNFAWEFQNNKETIGICCFFPIDIEIVGNTYDNPELLEDFE